MKNSKLAKILGIKGSFNYESDLYSDKKNSTHDFLKEEKIPTSQGHLD